MGVNILKKFEITINNTTYASQRKACEQLGLPRRTIQRRMKESGKRFEEIAEEMLAGYKPSEQPKTKKETTKNIKDNKKKSSKSDNKLVIMGVPYTSQRQASEALGLVRSTIQRSANRNNTSFEIEAERLYKEKLAKESEKIAKPTMVSPEKTTEKQLEDILPVGEKEIVEQEALYQIGRDLVSLDEALKILNINKNQFRDYSSKHHITYQDLITQIYKKMKENEQKQMEDAVPQELKDKIAQFNGNLLFYKNFDKKFTGNPKILDLMQNTYTELNYYQQFSKVSKPALLVYPIGDNKFTQQQMLKYFNISGETFIRYVKNFEMALESIDNDYGSFILDRYENTLYALLDALNEGLLKGSANETYLEGFYPKSPIGVMPFIDIHNLSKDTLKKKLFIHKSLCSYFDLEVTSTESLIAFASVLKANKQHPYNILDLSFKNPFEALEYLNGNTNYKIDAGEFLNTFIKLKDFIPDDLIETSTHLINYTLNYLIASVSFYNISLDGNRNTQKLENNITDNQKNNIKNEPVIRKHILEYFGQEDTKFIFMNHTYNSIQHACRELNIRFDNVKGFAEAKKINLEQAFNYEFNRVKTIIQNKKSYQDFMELTEYQRNLLAGLLKSNSVVRAIKHPNGLIVLDFVSAKTFKIIDTEFFRKLGIINLRMVTMNALKDAKLLTFIPDKKNENTGYFVINMEKYKQIILYSKAMKSKVSLTK